MSQESTSCGPSQDEVVAAVFSAPWKTPSQYAAYVGTVQRALDVTDHRRRQHEEMVSRMTEKSATDIQLAAQHDSESRAVLKARELHRRRIALTVSANSRKTNAQRAPHGKSALLSSRKDTPSVNHHVSSDKTLPARSTDPAIGSPTKPPLVGDDHLNVSLPVQGTVTSSAEQRKKVSSRQGHYVFEDEVGLIDIDEGDSDGGDSLDGEEKSLPAPSSSRKKHKRPDDTGISAITVDDRSGDGSEEASFKLASADDDCSAVIAVSDIEDEVHLDEARLIAFMIQLDDETDAMVRDIVSMHQCSRGEDLDWGIPDATRPKSQQATAAARVGVGSGTKRGQMSATYRADQSKSIAVYMSSLRPHGVRAVVDIEVSRRRNLAQSWKEGWDTLFGDYTRLTAAKRMKDHSTSRNAHVVMEQEAATRISMISRYQTAMERLKREEHLMAQKISRMAKFRGRLNAREEAIFRDDAKQRESLDQLAHKMLERVMRSHENDEKNVLVDNTDPWEGGRRRLSSAAGADGKSRRLSTALKAGTLLTQFYDGQRRRSTTMRRSSATPATDGSLAVEFSTALGAQNGGRSATFEPTALTVPDSMGGNGPTNRRNRLASTWAPPSVNERSKSLVPAVPGTPTPEQVEIPVSDNDDSRTKNPEKQKAIEARWASDAKKMAASVRRELLGESCPDFSRTYDERILGNEQKNAPSQGAISPSPMFSGFTFGESGLQSPDAPSALMPRETPQRSAVVTATDLNFGDQVKSAEGDENPIALALRKRKEEAQARNDERLTQYRMATNRHTLKNAVDAVIQGKLTRVSEFQEIAGLHRSFARREGYSSRDASPSDKDHGYLVDRLPSHTNFDVTQKISEMLSSPHEQPSLHSWTNMTALKLERDNADGDELKTLRSTSLARMRSLDCAGSHSNNRASFIKFSSATMEEDDYPAMELPGLSRRKSSFFHPSSAPVQKSCDGVQQPEDILLNGECHWVGGGGSRRSAESSITDRSLTDGSLSATLRRRRSNVASLVITSGLGRHDVASTRKICNGDTKLYAKQRARTSATLAAPGDPNSDHGSDPLEKTTTGWGDSNRSDDTTRRHKIRSVHFTSSREEEEVHINADPNASSAGVMVAELSTATTSSSSPAYELVHPVLPPLENSTSVPIFSWDDVEHCPHVDDHESSMPQQRETGGSRLSVSLRRATSILGKGSTSKSRSTPGGHKKKRSPWNTPDVWCLDASDFQ